MENIIEFLTTPKKSPASLTAARFKRVQDFKIVSSTDPTIYGQLGSSKWGDELHRFLADKKIAREDVQRWMETNSQVTEPLPKVKTCRHAEVIQIQRPPTASSSSSSTYSQNTGDTVVSAKTFNSAKYPNNNASPNPIFLNYAPTQAPAFKVQEFGIQNLSTASQTSQSETQNDCIPLDLSLRATAQEGEVSEREEILKDVAIGFDGLHTLVKLSQKYEQIPRSIFLLTIHKMYKRLKELQISVVPKIRDPYLPELNEVEMNPECIEMDEDMNNQYFGTVEEINLVTDTESTDGNIMDTQAGDEIETIDLSTESNCEDICGNFMNNQGDNDQIEENDLDGNQSENFDFSRYPNITVARMPISGSQQTLGLA